MPKLTKAEQRLLDRSKAVSQMVGSKAYQEGLKPWLEDKQSKSYPDPFDFKSEKEFNYAAKTASNYKKVVAEIIKYIEDEAPTQAKDLSNKKEGNIKEFGIGR